MFASWGRLIRRALVLGIGVAALALAGLFGTGVFAPLQSAGGFTAPASQSAAATKLAQPAFGRDVPDVVVLYASRSMTVADPAYRAAVTNALSRRVGGELLLNRPVAVRQPQSSAGMCDPAAPGTAKRRPSRSAEAAAFSDH
jgi:hypothetical protein